MGVLALMCAHARICAETEARGAEGRSGLGAFKIAKASVLRSCVLHERIWADREARGTGGRSVLSPSIMP